METFFGHLGTGGESFEEGARGAGQLFIVGLLVLGVRGACADLVDQQRELCNVNLKHNFGMGYKL